MTPNIKATARWVTRVRSYDPYKFYGVSLGVYQHENGKLFAVDTPTILDGPSVPNAEHEGHEDVLIADPFAAINGQPSVRLVTVGDESEGTAHPVDGVDIDADGIRATLIVYARVGGGLFGFDLPNTPGNDGVAIPDPLATLDAQPAVRLVEPPIAE